MIKKLLILYTFLSLNVFAQSWQVVGDMPHPVYGGKAIVKDSLIYIIGGFSDSLGVNVNLIQEYNPLTSSWRVVDTTITERYGLVADNYNDSILIMGGVESDLFLDSSLIIWNLNNPPYIYDFSLDFVRTFSTGLVYNNTLYVFGGLSVNPLSTYMLEYDIPSSTITFRNNFDFLLAAYPYQQMSALADSTIYLFGGVFIAPTRKIYSYDIQNRTLELLQKELAQSRTGGDAVSVSDSMIYIIGGINETNLALSSVEIFNINNADYQLTSGPAMNYGRSELMAVEYNNSIYVFGGKNALGFPVEQIEQFDYTVTDVEEKNSLGNEDFILYSNYPNPFNPSTLIRFYLPSESEVKLNVYNIAGEEVLELLNDVMKEGYHEAVFNTSEWGTSQLASGVYFYRLAAFNFSTQKTYIDTRKMILLK